MSDHDIAALLGEVERAIECGLTLPAHWYTDEHVLDLERQAIFRRTPQYVGDITSLREPGDFIASSVARVPVVLVCDEDRRVRGYVNACRHRCHEVVQGSGNRKVLQCPYHGWTYALDGSLRGVPRGEREGFDKSQWPLVAIDTYMWGPLGFVNLDTSQPSGAVSLTDLEEVARARNFSLVGMSVRRRLEYDCACNWKVLMENSCECYHCATTHPGFRAEFDIGPDEYVLERYPSFTYHRSPLRESTRAIEGNAERRDWEMYQVWPNLLLMTGSVPGINHVLLKLPVTPSRTRFLVEVWGDPMIDEESIDAEAEGWDIIFGEDKRVVESVQRGLQSGAIYEGPLLPQSERIIVEMQNRLRAWLSEATSEPRS